MWLCSPRIHGPPFVCPWRWRARGGRISILGFPGRGEPLPDFNPLDPKWFYGKQLTLIGAGFSPRIECQPADLRFNLRRNLEYLFCSDGERIRLSGADHYSSNSRGAHERRIRTGKAALEEPDRGRVRLADRMRYRRLGRTGFEVSEISLGTVEIGMPYGIAENGHVAAPDETAASRLLNHALDIGVNFIDTARAYGESEAIIGRALRNRRQEFFLTSKVISPHGQNLGAAQDTRPHARVSRRESPAAADRVHRSDDDSLPRHGDCSRSDCLRHSAVL